MAGYLIVSWHGDRNFGRLDRLRHTALARDGGRERAQHPSPDGHENRETSAIHIHLIEGAQDSAVAIELVRPRAGCWR